MNPTVVESTEEKLEKVTAAFERYRAETDELRLELDREARTGLHGILEFAELLDMHSYGPDSENIRQIIKAGRELLDLLERKLNPPAPTPGIVHFPSSKRCDVLYIEDSDANFTLVQRILEMRGIDPMRAATGINGVALALEHQPRLILLDLNLPDIDGSEVLHRLRQEPETAATPVVIISADATPSQIERLLAAGARNYLTKPFGIQPALAVIDEALAETAAAVG